MVPSQTVSVEQGFLSMMFVRSRTDCLSCAEPPEQQMFPLMMQTVMGLNIGVCLIVCVCVSE